MKANNFSTLLPGYTGIAHVWRIGWPQFEKEGTHSGTGFTGGGDIELTI